MRLWAIHPKYLDCKGLLATWREGLLAKKVLEGKTRGYRKHPELKKFMASKNPLKAINSYLFYIRKEASRRGYSFDVNKIDGKPIKERVSIEKEQIKFEFRHLKGKLKKRDPKKYRVLLKVRKIEANPLFKII